MRCDGCRCRCGELCLYRRVRARIAQTDRRALILVKRPPSPPAPSSGPRTRIFSSICCRFAVQGKLAATLRATISRGIDGSIDRSIGSVHARPPCPGPWPRELGGSGKPSEANSLRMLPQSWTVHFLVLVVPARPSSPRSAPLAVWLIPRARDLAVYLLREMARRKGTVENVATKGESSSEQRKKSACHAMPPRSAQPFLLASGFRLNAGLEFCRQSRLAWVQLRWQNKQWLLLVCQCCCCLMNRAG